MDVEKRREMRRQAARERVNRRLSEGGDAAVAELDAEYRSRQLTREATAERGSDFGTRTTRRRRSSSSDAVGRTMSAEELATFNEERDQALASSAREKAAIRGLVAFDEALFYDRLTDEDVADGVGAHCSFGKCAKRPKWMMPERAADQAGFTRVWCHEHVAPPA